MTEKLYYPFAQEPGQGIPDNNLVTNALNGDRNALDTLVARHHPWIYNIARRMVLKNEDAEDIAQEIIIKMLTKLSTYNHAKAAFNTWLYRIIVNHVINMKTRGYEPYVKKLEEYYVCLNDMQDEEPENTPEMQLMISDLKIGCLEGVFLCLDRRQRIVFILVVAFNVSDKQGSEIMEISKANFRKILSRARSKLFQYMDGNCGIVNEKSPCKCRNKVTGYVKAAELTPDKITFAQIGSPALKDLVSQKALQFSENIYSKYIDIYREHPFYKPPDLMQWMRELLQQDEFKQIFQLDSSKRGD
jgi:RNA polymerase sigma factor (sigma-70 family)